MIKTMRDNKQCTLPQWTNTQRYIATHLPRAADTLMKETICRYIPEGIINNATHYRQFAYWQPLMPILRENPLSNPLQKLYFNYHIRLHWRE